MLVASPGTRGGLAEAHLLASDRKTSGSVCAPLGRRLQVDLSRAGTPPPLLQGKFKVQSRFSLMGGGTIRRSSSASISRSHRV